MPSASQVLSKIRAALNNYGETGTIRVITSIGTLNTSTGLFSGRSVEDTSIKFVRDTSFLTIVSSIRETAKSYGATVREPARTSSTTIIIAGGSIVPEEDNLVIIDNESYQITKISPYNFMGTVVAYSLELIK